MKRIFALLIAALISVSIVRAGEVKIDVVITTGMNAEPTTTLPADTGKVFALFKTQGLQGGEKLRGVWIADDVGTAMAKGTKLDEKTVTQEGDTEDGVFSLSKPTRGWPIGKYHIDIYVNDDLTSSAKFKIKAAGPSKKDSEDEDHSTDE
jgi:tRNA (Thr-GGU) A37 N-methylase